LEEPTFRVLVWGRTGKTCSSRNQTSRGRVFRKSKSEDMKLEDDWDSAPVVGEEGRILEKEKTEG